MPKITDPIKIGTMELPHRIIAAPMVINRATEDGFVTERMVKHYERKAAGGYSLVQVEASHIRWDDRGFPKMLGIHDDRCIAGLRAITEAIHRQGVKCSIQIQHSGRQGNYAVTRQTLVAPSDTTPRWANQPTRTLSLEECEEMIDAYVQAARRAKAAGFDAVLIHGAHGFLINQFMSPYTNHRKDIYGDPLAFVTEVIRRVRAQVGPYYPVMIRVSAEEFMGEKGLTIERFCEMAPKLVEAGVDAIDVSAGIYETVGRMIPCGYYPRGVNVYLAEAVKKVVDVPVIAAGRINDPRLARSIVESGRADIVAVGRQPFADPDFALKTLQGRDDEIRQCIACDWCTERLFQRFHVECAINFFFTREMEYDERNLAPALRKKKVCVVGGGVAGMEAARVAALRGHEVVLFEKSQKLGGLVSTVASQIPRLNTRDLNNIVTYLTKQLQKLPNVTVKLGCEASVETISQEKPDVVILATGSEPVIPEVPGIGSSKVITLDKYLSEKCAVGEKVVVVGGHNGAETAVSLAREGKKVAIVEESTKIAEPPYITPLASRHWLLLDYVKEEGIEVFTQAKLKEIVGTGVVIVDKDGKEHTLEADTIIIAGERRAKNELYSQLRASVPEVYCVGDCVAPRKIFEAIHEAASRALAI